MEAIFERQEGASVRSVKRRIYDLRYDDRIISYKLTAGVRSGKNAESDIEEFFASFKPY